MSPLPRFRFGFFALAGAAFLSATVALAATLADVRFATYRSNFARGDSIVIEQIKATSSDWHKGDTVFVRGRYTLGSSARATLAIFVTAKNPGDGRSSGGPRQTMRIDRGTGEFELECTLPYEGSPHVSFYPSGYGSSFGGVYFRPAGR